MPSGGPRAASPPRSGSHQVADHVAQEAGALELEQISPPRASPRASRRSSVRSCRFTSEPAAWKEAKSWLPTRSPAPGASRQVQGLAADQGPRRCAQGRAAGPVPDRGSGRASSAASPGVEAVRGEASPTTATSGAGRRSGPRAGARGQVDGLDRARSPPGPRRAPRHRCGRSPTTRTALPVTRAQAASRCPAPCGAPGLDLPALEVAAVVLEGESEGGHGMPRASPALSAAEARGTASLPRVDAAARRSTSPRARAAGRSRDEGSRRIRPRSPPSSRPAEKSRAGSGRASASWTQQLDARRLGEHLPRPRLRVEGPSVSTASCEAWPTKAGTWTTGRRRGHGDQDRSVRQEQLRRSPSRQPPLAAGARPPRGLRRSSAPAGSRRPAGRPASFARLRRAPAG